MEISIIGGGITGLTTALALQKLDIEAKVYERADSLNEIGAGVWLQPNAMQVMKWLGLHNSVIQEGCVLNKMEITYSDLTPIKKINSQTVSDIHGNQTVAIHRGKLQKILFDAFTKKGEVQLGSKYLSQSKVDDRIQVKFESGEILTDIVLGADGIKSNVRESIGLPSQYRKSSQICCRGIANMDLPEFLKNEGKEIWGKKKRFGLSQISDGKVYFFSVLNEEICPKTLNKESLSHAFKEFHPIVTEIIQATDFLHTTELIDLTRLDTWHKGNTCLLGDAAHATTPNMGQGACQGIEDAYYFSNLWKRNTNSIENVFRTFEESRRKKVDYVVNNSWRFGQMAHGSITQNILKGIMKITPQSVMNKQMNSLYEIKSF